MGIGKPFYERMDELGWAMEDISEQDGVRQLLRRSGVQTLRRLGLLFSRWVFTVVALCCSGVGRATSSGSR